MVGGFFYYLDLKNIEIESFKRGRGVVGAP
jgi:hypothetical protein